jgi:hypothetical protein
MGKLLKLWVESLPDANISGNSGRELALSAPKPTLEAVAIFRIRHRRGHPRTRRPTRLESMA